MISPFEYKPPQDPLCVLHQEDDLLVVDKPSGLLSVPGKATEHSDCLEFRVKQAFPDALLVHRLDMDTSGVMVFAQSKPAQRHLGLQFERRHTAKTYEARVAGYVAGNAGTVDLPLIVDWPNRPLQMVDMQRGKQAQTHWSVLERESNATRVQLTPVTGRSHQLRVHMRELGHTILGDRFYGSRVEIAAADRLQLHATRLELFHPNGGKRLSFESPAPF